MVTKHKVGSPKGWGFPEEEEDNTTVNSSKTNYSSASTVRHSNVSEFAMEERRAAAQAEVNDILSNLLPPVVLRTMLRTGTLVVTVNEMLGPDHRQYVSGDWIAEAAGQQFAPLQNVALANNNEGGDEPSVAESVLTDTFADNQDGQNNNLAGNRPPVAGAVARGGGSAARAAAGGGAGGGDSAAGASGDSYSSLYRGSIVSGPRDIESRPSSSHSSVQNYEPIPLQNGPRQPAVSPSRSSIGSTRDVTGGAGTAARNNNTSSEEQDDRKPSAVDRVENAAGAANVGSNRAHAGDGREEEKMDNDDITSPPSGAVAVAKGTGDNDDDTAAGAKKDDEERTGDSNSKKKKRRME